MCVFVLCVCLCFSRCVCESTCVRMSVYNCVCIYFVCVRVNIFFADVLCVILRVCFCVSEWVRMCV